MSLRTFYRSHAGAWERDIQERGNDILISILAITNLI